MPTARRPAPLLALLTALLPGCLGGTAYWRNHVHFEAPRLAPEVVGTVVTNDAATPLDARALVEAWGAPDEKTVLTDRAERWVYVSDTHTWTGIMPVIVILPIPLMLPIGHESASFTLRDGIVTGVDLVTEHEATALVGLVVTGGPCMDIQLNRFEGPRHDPDGSRFLRIEPRR
jgi:hypothetical protein